MSISTSTASSSSSPRKPWETGTSTQPPPSVKIPYTNNSNVNRSSRSSTSSTAVIPHTGTTTTTTSSNDIAANNSHTAQPDISTQQSLIQLSNNKDNTNNNNTNTNVNNNLSALSTLNGLQHSNMYSPMMGGGGPLMNPMGLNGIYASAPFNQLNTSLATFGRFSQLLQLNVDSTYMSFSSLLRLFDSYTMLKYEMMMIGQTFTTLNIFAYLGRKIYRMIEWLLGRTDNTTMRDAWRNAATIAAPDILAKHSESTSFFSGWTWTCLYVAITWSIVRWIARKINQRWRKKINTKQTEEEKNNQQQPPATQQQQQQQPTTTSRESTSADGTTTATGTTPTLLHNDTQINNVTNLMPLPPSGLYPSSMSSYSGLGGYGGYGGLGGIGMGMGMGGYGGYGGYNGYGGLGGMNGYGGLNMNTMAGYGLGY